MTKHLLAASVASWCLVAAGFAQPQQPAPTTLEELRMALSNHLAQPHFDAAEWGVKIVSLDSGSILFEHQPGKLLSPASNTKLYTVAAALDHFGPQHRITTSLYVQPGATNRGVLRGDLVVYGRGDPTINSRLHGGDLRAALAPLAESVASAGIRRITGDVVADETFFTGPPWGSGWTWDDPQSYYGAEISALTIEDNTLVLSVSAGTNAGTRAEVRVASPWPRTDKPAKRPVTDPCSDYLTISNRAWVVDSGSRLLNFYRPIGENLVYVSGRLPVGTSAVREDVTVHRPAGLFAACLRRVLEERGIRVEGATRVIDWLSTERKRSNYSGWVAIGRRESPPLADLAREIQKPSQNLYTDLLLAYLGEAVRQTNSTANSEDLGVEALEKFLGKAGIARGSTVFEEGSGLSRNNLTTAAATVRLLQFMDAHPHRAVYFEALPIAGVDGTLRNRMKQTAAAGNLRAKTGTLRWANSLSGCLTNRAGERLAFSLMLNRYASADPQKSARNELDAIASTLAALPFKTAASPPIAETMLTL